MLILGLIFLLLGLLLGVPVLWVIGLVLAAVGAIVWLGDSGGAPWGRRWY
jgi:hypothetical protein